MVIKANFVDLQEERIFPANVIIANDTIQSVEELNDEAESNQLPFILPGFIDAHVHIESSMLIPSQFARLAVVHGTVATVSDPHEIANVCGMEGVEYMIADGKRVPFGFYFGAPSCVPATGFETAGATLNVDDVKQLLNKPEIKYLSEMMNFPGVLMRDTEVMAKISAAHQAGKPVDGHAPGLNGEEAKQYIAAGISTDHECFTKEEALHKIRNRMYILIREGSAAKNFEALIELLNEYPDKIMFCSDDKHPDSLVEGHINQLCARAVAKGINVFNVLKAACVNPVVHYKLETGLLKAGDRADFILVKDLVHFEVLQTYVKGLLVADKGKSLIELSENDTLPAVNNFSCQPKSPADFSANATIALPEGAPVIEAFDGQLITGKWQKRNVNAINVEEDILKIAVINRYQNAPVAIAYIKNFGLKKGAIASSVAHDSHNIVAVGADDESICAAVNCIIQQKGGVSLYADNKEIVLPLPVAGLMSDKDGYVVAEQYATIDKAAKELGSTLNAPFMTLSFMALLVIPHLKLSDKGLFDGDTFGFV